MKVGDLVALSEYGIARDFNRNITSNDPYQFGIIIKLSPKSSYPFKVKWLKCQDNWGSNLSAHHRRELKFARKRKK